MRVFSLIVALVLLAAPVVAQPRWQTLPPTPTLPPAQASGTLPINGVRIWYASFGAEHPGVDPVILLHGGLANSNYWGLLVAALTPTRRVVVMDSRGHGRSTRDRRGFGYDLMADDVVGLMDALHMRRAAIVGWSDGAILGLDLALRHADRVSRVFSFAANTDTSGVAPNVEKNPNFAAYIDRAGQEYAALSPTPGQYDGFVGAISHMWASQPNWSAARLRGIHTPVMVVDGDHDEAIRRAHTDMMSRSIRGARLLILPETSHFAFLQDPAGFNAAVLAFLDG